jgi:hypothetical protein
VPQKTPDAYFWFLVAERLGHPDGERLRRKAAQVTSPADIDEAQNKYAGEWKDGRHQGQGMLTIPDGPTYVGWAKNGKPNGEGTITAADDVFLVAVSRCERLGYAPKTEHYQECAREQLRLLSIDTQGHSGSPKDVRPSAKSTAPQPLTTDSSTSMAVPNGSPVAQEPPASELMLRGVYIPAPDGYAPLNSSISKKSDTGNFIYQLNKASSLNHDSLVFYPETLVANFVLDNFELAFQKARDGKCTATAELPLNTKLTQPQFVELKELAKKAPYDSQMMKRLSVQYNNDVLKAYEVFLSQVVDRRLPKAVESFPTFEVRILPQFSEGGAWLAFSVLITSSRREIADMYGSTSWVLRSGEVIALNCQSNDLVKSQQLNRSWLEKVLSQTSDRDE